MTGFNIEGQVRPNREYISSSPVNIVHLNPDQWIVLRDLKLRSLEQEPIAFADVETERAKYLSRSEAEWRAILSGKMSAGRAGETIMLFAQKEGEYVGMVSAIIPEGQTAATVQHMFVDKNFRRQGIGEKLLLKLIEEKLVEGGARRGNLIHNEIEMVLKL